MNPYVTRLILMIILGTIGILVLFTGVLALMGQVFNCIIGTGLLCTIARIGLGTFLIAIGVELLKITMRIYMFKY